MYSIYALNDPNGSPNDWVRIDTRASPGACVGRMVTGWHSTVIWVKESPDKPVKKPIGISAQGNQVDQSDSGEISFASGLVEFPYPAIWWVFPPPYANGVLTNQPHKMAVYGAQAGSVDRRLAGIQGPISNGVYATSAAAGVSTQPINPNPFRRGLYMRARAGNTGSIVVGFGFTPTALANDGIGFVLPPQAGALLTGDDCPQTEIQLVTGFALAGGQKIDIIEFA